MRALPFILFIIVIACKPSAPDYDRARWNQLHFAPASLTASQEDCLKCHGEILKARVLPVSQAGVRSDSVLAWYQTLDTYEGNQEDFHIRHLTGPLAIKYMNLTCNTCHTGLDPGEESNTKKQKDAFHLRKQVNVETTCLKCHGQFPYQVMSGLSGPWEESGEIFSRNCMSCHAGIRTNRHQVTYLKAKEIEEGGTANSNVCYGCHGGRAWYRISYPYARHSWEGMPEEVPAWAKNRPTQSEERFRLHP